MPEQQSRKTQFHFGGRASGVLCHISSLPSPYGIGSFGQAARDFVDFLHAAGQRVWQILPLGTTGFGDSPYQNFSMHAGNPYFIDLDNLVELDLLEAEAPGQLDFGQDPKAVDYGQLWENRRTILTWAWERFKFTQPRELLKEFLSFQEDSLTWLNDYSLFMAIKEEQGGKSWSEWPRDLKFREQDVILDFQKEHSDKIEFYAFVQFLFFRQWKELKDYAEEKGVLIMGDIPIYIAADSVETWKEPELFLLDENLSPSFVAGCPPDFFSEDGQLWGNPLYDWDKMAESDYSWWVERIRFSLSIYDLIRIDHFRGFESFWAVPFGDLTARRGTYMLGPGSALFERLIEVLGPLPLVVEDLGVLTDAVHELRDEFDLPGMKVMQFAFWPGADSEYLPHHMIQNCVAYLGSHDNDTLKAWLEQISEPELDFIRRYLGLGPERDLARELLRTLQISVADLAIMQMQDLLALGNEARMNWPGEATGNWRWRFLASDLTAELAKEFKDLATLAGRWSDQKAEVNTEESSDHELDLELT